MTPRVRVLDRTLTLLLGLGLVVLALFAFDWRFGVVGRYQDSLPTGPASDVVASGWWPWVFALATVLLGLLALAWLLAHLRRPGPSSQRLDSSDETGRLEVDLRSVAAAAAERFATMAPVTGARGTTEARGRRTLLVLHASVDPAADATTLTEATEASAREVAAAFPDDDVRLRVVLDAPRRKRLGRGTDRVRVR
ncbi:hypothetical protein INN71_01780 [Nocardioides sp. ChNu-153]|uniref:hypothetical protein n=1 Tax=unclassified Nocardioides TaxID=2615069 RepID=UPI002406C91D|nr:MULTISPECIES: hypothetical protein [unclassified Nocardioides]MDF9714758.1 hypothetical protein [Nocardioides sp. ChNu-99]MDN7120116.1 hypothetical protein [Nocardioides sp. ChNu-153]